MKTTISFFSALLFLLAVTFAEAAADAVEEEEYIPELPIANPPGYLEDHDLQPQRDDPPGNRNRKLTASGSGNFDGSVRLGQNVGGQNQQPASTGANPLQFLLPALPKLMDGKNEGFTINFNVVGSVVVQKLHEPAAEPEQDLLSKKFAAQLTEQDLLSKKFAAQLTGRGPAPCKAAQTPGLETRRLLFARVKPKIAKESFEKSGALENKTKSFSDLRNFTRRRVCEDPGKYGPCTVLTPDAFERSTYYFDLDTRNCVRVPNGACGVQRNHFTSEEDCYKYCGSFKPTKLSPLNEVLDPSFCLAENDANKTCGEQKIRQFYFDVESGQCVSFWWGRCKPPYPNRFQTRTSCERICSQYLRQKNKNTTGMSSKCLKQAVRGSCQRLKDQYYYNTKLNMCIPFLWSGCDTLESESNRFDTKAECDQQCTFRNDGSLDLKPTELVHICDEPKSMDTGFGCANGNALMWYYDKGKGLCESLIHGDCGRPSHNLFFAKNICTFNCQRNYTTLPMECQPFKMFDLTGYNSYCTREVKDQYYEDKFYYDGEKQKCVQNKVPAFCLMIATQFDTREACEQTCLLADKPNLKLNRKQ